MEKKLIALIFISLLMGLGVGYGLGYAIYRPYLLDLESDISGLQSALSSLSAYYNTLNSTYNELKTSYDDLNKIIWELNNSNAGLKTIRFVETEETILEVPGVYGTLVSKNASRVFTWTPRDSSNNVILLIYWWFESKGNITFSGLTGGFEVIFKMAYNQSGSWSFWDWYGSPNVSTEYKRTRLHYEIPQGPQWYAPDCVSYKFWLSIIGYQPSNASDSRVAQPFAAYVKNLNIILIVADGISASNP